MTATVDPLALSQALIRCASVTPADAGALDVLVQALAPMGFVCHRLRFSQSGTADVDNLYARLGTGEPHLCFAGHTDVVPPGDEADWSLPPFAAEISDGRLFGRGAADMKGAIACFAAAVGRFLAARDRPFDGSLSLLVTGDEEGPAVNGTVKVLDWLSRRGETMTVCLVGEPTCRTTLGDMIKIGRRGSLNGILTVEGVQGHAAYPELADNPIPRLTRMLLALTEEPLDSGTDHFEPSRAVITSVDVGNTTTNVIPGRARARFNIRFNDRHTEASLTRLIADRCRSVDDRFSLEVTCSGEAFLSAPGPWSALVARAVQQVTGRVPALGTTGGTSDARFIHSLCPVVEFGLPGEKAHKVDESVAVADIAALTDVYEAVLHEFFSATEPWVR